MQGIPRTAPVMPDSTPLPPGPVEILMPGDAQPKSKVLLLATDAIEQQRLGSFIRSLEYQVAETGIPANGALPDVEQQPDVVVIAAGDQAPAAGLVQWLTQGEQPVPVILLGAGDRLHWRQEAIAAGAFACASLDSHPEEHAGLLAAASRYRSVQMENRMLRNECERICSELVKAFGEAADKLRMTSDQVEHVKRTLEQIQSQIIKVFA